MSIDVPTPDPILMSQRERDVLKVMHAVLRHERTQVQAARWLDLSVRQVPRLRRKLEADGDAAGSAKYGWNRCDDRDGAFVFRGLCLLSLIP